MSESRRPQRKLPDVPDPLYGAQGHRKTIKGVPCLYLEDVERAYRVMEAYVPYSPWEADRQSDLQRMQVFESTIAASAAAVLQANALIKRIKAEAESRSRQMEVISDSLALLETRDQKLEALADGLRDLEKIISNDDLVVEQTISDPPTPIPESPPPIQIETEEYEPAFTLEQLKLIPETQSASITMSVGYGDLRLRCNARDCNVSTNSNAPEAYKAFRQLVAIVEGRSSRFAVFMHSGQCFVLLFLASIILIVINLYIKESLVSRMSMAVSILFSVYVFWEIFWPKRQIAVVLQYRKDSPGFWARNAEPIIKGVVITVIAAILIAIFIRAVTGTWPNSQP